MSDYRCTPYGPSFDNVPGKKDEFKDAMSKKHRRAKNWYRIVNPRGSSEHKAFAGIYGYKCAYCGTSVKIIPAQLFDVDHIRPQADKSISAEEINALDNLVLACHDCNNGKSDYWFSDLSGKWSPDGMGIAQIFVRDDSYTIHISEGFDNDDNVCELYRVLKLGEQYRRLDYLLMMMKGYIDTLPEGSKKRLTLTDICNRLHEKRNCVGL